MEAGKIHQEQTAALLARVQEEHDALAAAQAKVAALTTQVELGSERLEALTNEIKAEQRETHVYRSKAEVGARVLAVKEAELATAKLVQKDLNDQVRALREAASRLTTEHREAERRWAEERAELRGQAVRKSK